MQRFFALTVLFCLGVFFAFVPRTHALPAQEVETIYFANDGSQMEVGGSILFCNGFTYTYGSTSQYKAKFMGESCTASGSTACVICLQSSGSGGFVRVSCNSGSFDTKGYPFCPGEPTG